MNQEEQKIDRKKLEEEELLAEIWQEDEELADIIVLNSILDRNKIVN